MAAVFVPTIGRFPSCLRWSLVVSLIQFNSVPPRPCLPLVAQASSDLAEGVERSLRLEVALEPKSRFEPETITRRLLSLLFEVIAKCDVKGEQLAFPTSLKLGSAKLGFKATRGCQSKSTESSLRRWRISKIVRIRTFAVGSENRPLVSFWPWLLTAIWGKETCGRKTNYGFYRNKVSNNLGAAPGNWPA